MIDFIVNGIFWILAIYGLIEIVKTIIEICTYAKFKTEGIYVIIAAKNQENKIEGFLRTILFRIVYGKEEYIKEILVTDLDSTDNTMEILTRLSKEYDCIKPIKWKECKEVIESIDKS